MIPARAISLHAPWAWALMYGGKDVENRSLNFPRGVTGRVWVHASKWPGESEVKRATHLLDELASVFECVEKSQCPRVRLCDLDNMRGHIVGSIEVTGYTETSDSAWYVPGSLAINVRDPRPLATPVPAKGALGWWKIDRHPGLSDQLKEVSK